MSYSHNLLNQVKGNTLTTFTANTPDEIEALKNALRSTVTETEEQKARAKKWSDELINGFHK